MATLLGARGKGDIAVWGVPMDFTASWRPGSRFAYDSIKLVSHGLELYSPYFDRSLENVAFEDAGDAKLIWGNVSSSLDAIREQAEEILNTGKKLISIGGDHLVTYPLIQATKKKYPNLAVVHFDAHTDLRETFLGDKLSHATVLRHVANEVGSKSLAQIGIRSGEREEFIWGRENTHFFPDREWEIIPATKEVVKLFAGRPTYITLDIDVLDPAYAPGTGTPEPGGCTSKELFKALYLLLENLNVIGADIVEIAPDYDSTERTAFMGAKILREMLIGMSK